MVYAGKILVNILLYIRIRTVSVWKIPYALSFFIPFQNITRRLEMAWAAKRPANEPLTGIFTGPLTAQFYLLFLLGR